MDLRNQYPGIVGRPAEPHRNRFQQPTLARLAIASGCTAGNGSPACRRIIACRSAWSWPSNTKIRSSTPRSGSRSAKRIPQPQKIFRRRQGSASMHARKPSLRRLVFHAAQLCRRRPLHHRAIPRMRTEFPAPERHPAAAIKPTPACSPPKPIYEALCKGDTSAYPLRLCAQAR